MPALSSRRLIEATAPYEPSASIPDAVVLEDVELDADMVLRAIDIGDHAVDCAVIVAQWLDPVAVDGRKLPQSVREVGQRMVVLAKSG